MVRGVCPEGVLSGSFCPFSEEVAEQFCASHFNHKGFSLGEPDVGGGFSSQKEVPNHFQVASRDQPPTGTCHSVPESVERQLISFYWLPLGFGTGIKDDNACTMLLFNNML